MLYVEHMILFWLLYMTYVGESNDYSKAVEALHHVAKFSFIVSLSTIVLNSRDW